MFEPSADIPTTLSPLETLPCDLICMIFDYIPESVVDLILASRTLAHRVDEFALQRKFTPFVEEVKFTETVLTTEKTMWMYFPTSKLSKYELRLNQLKLAHLGISSSRYKYKFVGLDFVAYGWKFSGDDIDENVLSFITRCIGNSIEKANIECDYPSSFSVASKVLSRLQFRKLRAKFTTLSDDSAEILLCIIDANRVEQLELLVKRNSSRDPVSLLHRISALVQSLKIVQLANEAVPDDKNYMFGVFNIDWSATILEMFSRKVDKLCLDNRNFPQYLNVSALKMKLPNLEKYLWFETTCNILLKFSTKSQEFSVKVAHDDEGEQIFSVKHQSRDDEQFEM